MASRSSATRSRPQGARSVTDVPVVGPREPCPCGSGKRYKVCHGRAARAAATAVDLRPYRGLPAEPDWVAMHEIVPAATATAATVPGALAQGTEGEPLTVVTVLPGAERALRRAVGGLVRALQGGSDPDASAAAAAALRSVVAGGSAGTGGDAGAGDGVGATPAGDAPGPASGSATARHRLQDVVDTGATFTVTVHDDFSFWLDGSSAAEGEGSEAVRQAVAQAGEAVVPTVRLDAVEAAYWAQVGNRRHLRWVLPEDEQRLLDALARLHVGGGLAVGQGSRYLGAFRALGLLVPVWDLADDVTAADLEEPARALRARLDEALATTSPLRDDERRARAGVVARQVTLR